MMTRFSLAFAASGVFLGAASMMAHAAIEDSDGDGLYSFEEVIAAYPTLTEEAFLELDGDGDGMLTPEEVTAAQAAGVLPTGG